MTTLSISRPARPTLTFLGAAGTVTGSRFLVETPESTVLVDCGMFQGRKQDRLRNWAAFPYDPASIDAVIVTHAHIDHVGYLPRLVDLGFTGPVYCTPGTAELASIVLPDSGHLQEEDAAFANRKGFSKHRPALPLYTEASARASLTQLLPVAYSTPTSVTADVSVTFEPAGHILGSSTVALDLDAWGRRVLFSGDLGRPHHPLFVAPTPPRGADVVVMESTYGGRAHDDAEGLDRLADVIRRTAARGGSIVIPAFAVDRTEVVLHALRTLMQTAAVPDLPVYADSPMALRALQVYRRAIADRSPEISPALYGVDDPFDTGQLTETRDAQDSKALADLIHPVIIVSASGMATGGRVLHHLARMLPDRRNAVVLVGFQAQGTRGQRLADGEREIKMFGRYVPVRAEVATIGSFSVHADHDELLGWLGSADREPDTTFLVHGEGDGQVTLHDAIEDDLGWTAAVARDGERVRLD